MKGNYELEGTRSNFTPWLRDFEYQNENCLGVVATPFGELGLIILSKFDKKKNKNKTKQNKKTKTKTWNIFWVC